MKSYIKELFFDKEVVTIIKNANVNKEQMYNLLFSGRITMEEYLNATV
ncbi:MAG: hypothetical protein ABIN67_11645 [Ferruginibacter sp.]